MMNKKWSFSSALSFTSASHKHKSDALSSGLPSPGLLHGAQVDGTLSPPSVYASPMLSTSELDGLAPPPALSHKSSGTSESENTTRAQPLSATTNGYSDEYAVPVSAGTSTSRRGTTASLPFFRRSSSTSFQAASVTSKTSAQKVAQEPAARHDKSGPNATGSQQRKTVLGIGIPAMLGGHKRNSITQEMAPSEGIEDAVPNEPRSRHERKGSFGWAGRKRGKVSGD